MNIVLATTSFLPDVYGGVETYTLELAQEMQRRGHRVRVICTRRVSGSDLAAQDEEVFGLSVRRIHYDPAARPLLSQHILFDPEIAGRVGQVLSEWRADVVHVTNFPGLSAAIVLEAQKRSIPVVWTATDFGMTCARFTLQKWDGSLCPGTAGYAQCLDCLRPRSRLNTWCYRWLARVPPRVSFAISTAISSLPLRRPAVFDVSRMVHLRLARLLPLLRQIDLIVAPSSWMREVLVMNGAEPERIVVSEYGISAPHLNSPRTYQTPPRFAFLGRIHPMKGVDLLIEAFNRIGDPQGATLTIYGSPAPDQYEYAGCLWAMAGANPHIVFGKRVDRDQVTTVLGGVDVLVVPSTWYENSPVAILEAFAHCVPVLASDVAGVRDLVQHEVNGLLFRQGDPDDLAVQMQRLISDPGLVRRLAENIQPVKDIRQDAAYLLERYQGLIGQNRMGV